MPGFDESLYIPQHLEPPRLDADETLPNMLHPSYPFGRPVSIVNINKSRIKGGIGIGNLISGLGAGTGNGNGNGSRGVEDRWDELGDGGLVEKEIGKEVPPGMAVSCFLVLSSLFLL
jgi:hypothetical protein